MLPVLLQVAAAAGQIALPVPVAGDFDRDGRSDVAAVERNPADGTYALTVRRGDGPVSLVAPIADPRTIFLTVLPDGTLSYGPVKGPQLLVRWVDGRFTVTPVAG